MRPLLPLALLLAACSPLATPAPYAPAPAMLQVTDAPDLRATQYAIDAQVRLEAERTETAQAHAIATRTQVAAETQAAGTAMFASASATGAAVSYSVTLQAIAAQQATGTFESGAATQTATAAIPAGTATAAAQVAMAEREGMTWVWSGVVITAILLIAAAAGAILVYSFGAVQIANSQAAIIRENSLAYERETRAIAEATQIKIFGRVLATIVRGEITSTRYIPGLVIDAQTNHQESLPPPSQVATTGDYADAYNLVLAGMFVKAELVKRENPEKWPANRLPGAEQFQQANAGGWAREWPPEVAALIPRFASAGMWTEAKRGMEEFLVWGPRGTYAKTGQLAHLANALKQAQSRAAMMTNGD